MENKQFVLKLSKNMTVYQLSQMINNQLQLGKPNTQKLIFKEKLLKVKTCFFDV